MSKIPPQITGQKYIDLATTRKNGAVVHTPVWFAEENDQLYVMTSTKTGKFKRIRNNPTVKVAPATIRGKIIGPQFAAVARIMRPEEFAAARRRINAKYWLARLPFVWRSDAYFEISFGDSSEGR